MWSYSCSLAHDREVRKASDNSCPCSVLLPCSKSSRGSCLMGRFRSRDARQAPGGIGLRNGCLIELFVTGPRHLDGALLRSPWSGASVPDLRNAHPRKCMGLLASTCLLGSWHSTVRNTVCSIRGPVDRVLEVMTLVMMRTQKHYCGDSSMQPRTCVPSRYGNPTSSCSL